VESLCKYSEFGIFSVPIPYFTAQEALGRQLNAMPKLVLEICLTKFRYSSLMAENLEKTDW
jgi:hypothetical protein